MKTETKHTPTAITATAIPSRLRQINKRSVEGVYHLRDDFQGHRIGLVYDREQATFIVTACNAHDELVDIIRLAMPFLETHESPLLERARAALKKAESE